MREHQVVIDEIEISKRVHQLALEISKQYRGEEIVLVGILKGAFVFLTDLAREIEVQSLDGNGVRRCFIEFLSVSSYGDSREPGDVKIELDIRRSVRGMHVLIVEDVADTLQTLHRIRQHLLEKSPESVRIAVMLAKPHKHQRDDVPLEFVGFSGPYGFVYGYGMDLEGAYRALPFIAEASIET